MKLYDVRPVTAQIILREYLRIRFIWPERKIMGKNLSRILFKKKLVPT